MVRMGPRDQAVMCGSGLQRQLIIATSANLLPVAPRQAPSGRRNSRSGSVDCSSSRRATLTGSSPVSGGVRGARTASSKRNSTGERPCRAPPPDKAFGRTCPRFAAFLTKTAWSTRVQRAPPTR